VRWAGRGSRRVLSTRDVELDAALCAMWLELGLARGVLLQHVSSVYMHMHM
jgi:hypothetical protein